MNNILNYIAYKISNRYTVLRLIVLIIGLVLIARLWYLQIIKGEEYREISLKRLRREVVMQPVRGEIYDRNGRVIATNKLSFSVEMFKTNISVDLLNRTILNVITLLEKNSEQYTDMFPSTTTEFLFEGDKEKENAWKKANKVNEDATVEEVINIFKKKYKINNTDINETRKIIGIRYGMSQKGISIKQSYQIAQDVSQNTVSQIEENNIDYPGVNIFVQPKREYPYKEISSHLLGYVSKISTDELEKLSKDEYNQNSIIGKSGVEQMYEKYLKGTPGLKSIEVDSNGNAISETNALDPVGGKNITLTIDIRLQQAADNSLKKIITESKNDPATSSLGIESGSAVAIDVETGEVLAMSSYPSFDPNIFTKGIKAEDWNRLNTDKNKPLFNRAINGTYSPGSTFKMLVGIAALENKVVSTKELVTDLGAYPLSYHPKCWIYSRYHKTHGSINISEAIMVSCNYFFYEMGYRLGIDKIDEWAGKFGLGEKTGIDLYGENAGTVAGPSMVKNNEWYLGDTLSAAIGQSYSSFTPIQLANYISTIASGGQKNRLHLVKGISDSAGNRENSEDIIKYVSEKTGVNSQSTKFELASENIAAIKEGMRQVTSEEGGTAYSVFKNLPMQVGGKTGTVQVPNGADNGIFVGFAPYDNPKIAIAVVVEHGGKNGIPAKVVKEIVQEYYYTINGVNGQENNIIQNTANIVY